MSVMPQGGLLRAGLRTEQFVGALLPHRVALCILPGLVLQGSSGGGPGVLPLIVLYCLVLPPLWPLPFTAGMPSCWRARRPAQAWPASSRRRSAAGAALPPLWASAQRWPWWVGGRVGVGAWVGGWPHLPTAWRVAVCSSSCAEATGCQRVPRSQAATSGCHDPSQPCLLQVTLAVVLHPASRLGSRWRRLASGVPGGSGGGGVDDDDDDEEDSSGGFDTRQYAGHMSEGDAAAAAEAEAQRLRRLRQQQLEQEGVSLTGYDAVKESVRDRLIPFGSPSSAAPLPTRRLTIAAADAGGGIEMGRLQAIVESP